MTKQNAHIVDFWLCARVYPNTPVTKGARIGLCFFCKQLICYHPFVTSSSALLAKKVCSSCMIKTIPGKNAKKLEKELKEKLSKIPEFKKTEES